MSRTRFRIGLQLGIALLALCVPLSVSASAESPSYRLQHMEGAYNLRNSQTFTLVGGTSWIPEGAVASEHFLLITTPTYASPVINNTVYKAFENNRNQQQKRLESRLALQAGFKPAGQMFQFNPPALGPMPSPMLQPKPPASMPNEKKSPAAPLNYKFEPKAPLQPKRTIAPLPSKAPSNGPASRGGIPPPSAAKKSSPAAERAIPRAAAPAKPQRISARFSFKNSISLPLRSRGLQVSKLGGSLLLDEEQLHFFGSDKRRAENGLVFLALTLLALALFVSKSRVWKKKNANKYRRRGRKIGVAVLLLFLCTAEMSRTLLEGFAPSAHALQTTPAKRVFNGHLIGPNNQPINGPHHIRFSYWSNGDFISSDRTGSGGINVSAPNYVGWQETHAITPNFVGYFTVQLGSNTPLPELSLLPRDTLLNLHLQVEVKPAGAGESAYEVLDWDPSETLDRSPILSVPNARNADWLDQRDVGTGSGSIPVLSLGGIFKPAQIPGGTNSGTFVIDRDGSESSTVKLQFGSLIKTLSFDAIAGRFDFNDDVRIQGNLSVTGLINGVDIATLSGGSDTSLQVSSGGALKIHIAAGEYRLNGATVHYAGASNQSVAANTTNYVFLTATGLTITIGSYPTDRSYIALAEVLTTASTVASVTDRRTKYSDDRERTVEQYFHPEYPNVSFKGDGSNNVGQLWITNNSGSLNNHFVWSSTKSTLQDYDVYLPIVIPSDFVRWKNNPLEVTYRSSNSGSASNKLDIAVFDTADSAVTLSGSVTNLADTSWKTTSFEFLGTPAWVSGGTLVLRLRLHSKDNEQMQLGAVKAQWVEILKE